MYLMEIFKKDNALGCVFVDIVDDDCRRDWVYNKLEWSPPNSHQNLLRR